MGIKFIIHDRVVFSPDDHRLTPLGSWGKEAVLHTPVSRLLVLFLQNPGEVLRQEVILAEVWEKHGQLVTVNTLYQNISLLRKGLRSAGIITPSVKTLPKIGFSFKGTVHTIEEHNTQRVPSEPNSQKSEQLENTRPKERFSEDVAVIDKTDAFVQSQPGRVVSLKIKIIKYLKEKGALHIAYPAIFLLFNLLLLTSKPAQSGKFILSHDKIATINQCVVYTDRNVINDTKTKYISLLKEKDIKCNPNEFVYVTRPLTGDDALVLFCDTVPSGDMWCSTRFRLVMT